MPVIGVESMVTCTSLRYTWDYLMLGICGLIKPDAMEKLMSFHAIIHSHVIIYNKSLQHWIILHCLYHGCWCSGSALRWHRNGHGGVSNHQPRHCLLNHLFGCRSKKTSKLRVTGLCAGNSLVPGEFPAQMASNAENVSIWWRHHRNQL